MVLHNFRVGVAERLGIGADDGGAPQPAGGLLPRQRLRADRPAGPRARERRAHAGPDGAGAGDRGTGERSDCRHLDPDRHVRRLGRRRSGCSAGSTGRPRPGAATGWRRACSARACCCRAACTCATAGVSANPSSTPIRPATGRATASTGVGTANGSRWCSRHRLLAPPADVATASRRCRSVMSRSGGVRATPTPRRPSRCWSGRSRPGRPTSGLSHWRDWASRSSPSSRWTATGSADGSWTTR